MTTESFLFVGPVSGVQALGGRDDQAELWFYRSALGQIAQPAPLPYLKPRGPSSHFKRLKVMGGQKVEAAPPLRALESTLTEGMIERLVDRGYVVVDNALPSSLCRKLKAEMESLEANGQVKSALTSSSAEPSQFALCYQELACAKRPYIAPRLSRARRLSRP